MTNVAEVLALATEYLTLTRRDDEAEYELLFAVERELGQILRAPGGPPECVVVMRGGVPYIVLSWDGGSGDECGIAFTGVSYIIQDPS